MPMNWRLPWRLATRRERIEPAYSCSWGENRVNEFESALQWIAATFRGRPDQRSSSPLPARPNPDPIQMMLKSDSGIACKPKLQELETIAIALSSYLPYSKSPIALPSLKPLSGNLAVDCRDLTRF